MNVLSDLVVSGRMTVTNTTGTTPAVGSIAVMVNTSGLIDFQSLGSITGAVTGTGTINKLTKWTGSGSAIADSSITDASGTVTIAANTSTSGTATVSGNLIVSGGGAGMNLGPVGGTYRMDTGGSGSYVVRLLNPSNTGAGLALGPLSATLGEFSSTVTCTTLNGTTGINTGASAGTQRIDVSGNLVNIGTINSSSRTINSIGADTNLFQQFTSSANDTYHYRDVAGFGDQGVTAGVITGTIKIRLPVGWTNTMMKINIEGYDYSTASGWSCSVSGYNYLPGTAWFNYGATLEDNAPFTSIRLAFDGTYCCILLGTTSTTWTYPKIVITDVIVGHQSPTSFASGYVISCISSETGITNIVTPTINTGGNADTLDGLDSTYFLNASNINAGILSPTYGGTGVNNSSKTITLGGNLATSGAFSTTLTTTATTTLTLPTTGTLSTLAGAETFTNKVSYNGLVVTANTGVITSGAWNGTIVSPTYGGTGSSTTFTAGSVIFAGASGVYTQDNAGFFYDATNHRLGIGIVTPTHPIDISTTDSVSLVYQRTGVSAKKWGFQSDNSNTYWANITDSTLPLTLSNGGNLTLLGAVTGTSFIGNTAAATITGTTLASNVVNSSLTSVGALSSGSTASGFGAIVCTSVTASGAISTTFGGSGTSNLYGFALLLGSNGTNYIWNNQVGGFTALGTNGRGTASANANLVLNADQSSTFNASVSITGDLLPSGSLGSTGTRLVKGWFTDLTVTNPIAGSITGGAGSSTLVAITDDTTTNAVVYPTWVTSNSGNLPIKVSSTKLSFNPSTGLLTSVGFNGTTGINTGTAAGTQRIDSSGNLLNIGTVACGAITSSGALALGSNTITSGLINGQTISSAASFTGTLSAAGSITSTATGIFSSGTNASINFVDRVASNTWTLYGSTTVRLFNGTADVLTITTGGLLTLVGGLSATTGAFSSTVTASGLITSQGSYTTNRGQIYAKGISDHGLMVVDTDAPTTRQVGYMYCGSGTQVWSTYIPANTTDFRWSKAGTGDVMTLTAAGALSTVSTVAVGTYLGVGVTPSSDRAIYSILSGAQTITTFGAVIRNNATSSTNSINKTGIYLDVSGSFTGTGTTAYGLYIAGPLGAITNYAIYNASGADMYLGAGTVSAAMFNATTSFTTPSLTVTSTLASPIVNASSEFQYNGNRIFFASNGNLEKGFWNPFWTSLNSAKALYWDEEFATSSNSVSLYDNAAGGKVTHTRQTVQNGIPNSSGCCIKISYNGTGTPSSNPSPGFGGFVQLINSAINKVFVQRFVAKIPAGYSLAAAENHIGVGGASYWMTPTAGTGKWEQYIRVVNCGYAFAAQNSAIGGGGTGYTVNDILTVVGGTLSATGGAATQFKVTAVSSGVITAVTIQTAGGYYISPVGSLSVTGGTGTGATFSATYGSSSGYVYIASGTNAAFDWYLASCNAYEITVSGFQNLNADMLTTGTVLPARGGTGTTTQFTSGSVVYAGSSGVYSQDNTNLFWDATNHRLGIGNTTPAAGLHVVSSTTLDSLSAGLLISGAATAAKRVMIGYDTTSDYGFIAAAHTGTTWKPLLINPIGGNVSIGSTTATATFNVGSSAQFQVSSAGAVSTSGSITGAGLNSTGSNAITVTGAAATLRDIHFQTAGTNRWTLRCTNTAESGSNTGSDFQLIYRDDAGTSLGAVTVTRATGLITTNAGLTIAGAFTGATTGAFSSTVTGTILNGTTGINTGASAGTQRIDALGNLVNIGTVSCGAITSSGALAVTSITSPVYYDASGYTGAANTGTYRAKESAGATSSNPTTITTNYGFRAQFSTGYGVSMETWFGSTPTSGLISWNAGVSSRWIDRAYNSTTTNITGDVTISSTMSVGAITSSGALTLGSNTITCGAITSSSTISGTTITASSSFSGPGTNLTGTATTLNIGGNAATVSNWSSVVSRIDSNDYNQTARTQGIYAISGAGTNGPGTTYLNLIHCANSTDVAFQIAGGYTSDNMYFRGTSANNTGTGYTAWRTVLHSGNYNSYTPTLTGTGASGSWGISITGSSASSTGNAATATALQTARAINGVNFDGTAAITVTADANTLSGTTLHSTITASSLQSVGTLSSLTMGGTLAMGTNNITSTGSLGATGARLTAGFFTDLTVTNAISGSITGNAATATTAGTVTTAAQPTITSVGTLTSLTVTGQVAAGALILEPFVSNSAPTSGSQIRLGATGSLAATFGTRYSGGTTFVVCNAYQNTVSTDSWTQGVSASSQSFGLFFDPTTSHGSTAIMFKKASSGQAVAADGTFWSTTLATLSDAGVFTATSFSGSGAGLTASSIPITALTAGDYSAKLTSGSYSISITGSSGSCTGNAATATSATTAGTVTSAAQSAITSLGTLTSVNCSSFINFGAGTANPPNASARSTGTKVILYDNSASSTIDYALGIESGKMWFGLPLSSQSYNWYAGTTSVMTLSGTGTLTAGTITATTQFTGPGTGLTGTASTFTAGFANSALNTTNSAIADDNSTNATMYPVWVTSNAGNLPLKVSSSRLSFNPSSGGLTVGGDVSLPGHSVLCKAVTAQSSASNTSVDACDFTLYPGNAASVNTNIAYSWSLRNNTGTAGQANAILLFSDNGTTQRNMIGCADNSGSPVVTIYQPLTCNSTISGTTITATTFSGSGSGLTGTGASFTAGFATTAGTASTVTNSTQSAITSLGTLTGLNCSGFVNFGTSGANPPSNSARSTGTKIVLYDNSATSTIDYAMGIESAKMWFGIPTSSSGQAFTWYGATTPVMTLTGAGTLSVLSSVSASSFSGSGSGLSTNTIPIAAISNASAATGDLIYYNGTNWVRFPRSGTSGQVLTTNGSGTIAWGSGGSFTPPSGTGVVTVNGGSLVGTATGVTGSGLFVMDTAPTLTNVTINSTTSTTDFGLHLRGSAVSNPAVLDITSSGSDVYIANNNTFGGIYLFAANTRTPTTGAQLWLDLNGLCTVNGGLEVTSTAIFHSTMDIRGVTTFNANVVFPSASTLKFTAGTNQRAGNATLVAGTVTVSNASVTSNTIVYLARKTSGGTRGDLTYTLSAGSSFTINSASGTDTSVVSYLLIET